MTDAKLRSELTLFDVTNLVVGAIIGADVYVASSFGALYLGPSSLLVWVIAGIIAIVIALCFAQCAAMVTRVGGSYAYAREAWGPFAGFTVGWSLWLAEWLSLAVFPVAFTRYLMFFGPLQNLDFISQTIVKVLFVAFLAVTNIVGVKAAGRTNDVLTLVKLSPLVFFALIGLVFIILHPAVAASNFSPFFPSTGFANFGMTLVLIFWAYAGFEISTIPSDEIRDPGKTIPKAIIFGIAIVSVFYLTTNIILFGVRPSALLAKDTAPLASASAAVLSASVALALLGGAIVGVGALISVAGSDESGMIGTSRLAYALAIDGLFPSVFAKIHRKFQTPYLAVIIQAVTALIASIVGGLNGVNGGLNMLIATSVFFMAVAYVATSASIFSLRKKVGKPKFELKGGLLIPILGVIFSLYLITQCTLIEIAIGVILLLVGIPIYIKYSPKKELTELKEAFLSRESILERTFRQEETFIAHQLAQIKRLYRKRTQKKQTSN
jgi:APA family basic amino acid/polyamine antiporter